MTDKLIVAAVCIAALIILYCLRWQLLDLFLYILKSPVTYIRYRIGLGKLTVRPRFLTHGIVFGKAKYTRRLVSLKEEHEGHILCVGGTGTGKGASCIIPSLRHWQGTALVIEIAVGDIFDPVHEFKTRGGKEYPHARIEPDGENTAKYDVLHPVDAAAGNIGLQNVRLEQLAHALIPKQAQNDTAVYYESAARTQLTASLSAYYHASEKMDFPDICQQILRSTPDFLIQDILSSGNEFAISLATRFDGIRPETLAGVKETLDEHITLFATNERIRAAIGRGGISPADLENKSIYISIPESMLLVYRAFLAAFVSQTLHYFSDREYYKQPPILLVLDELCSLKVDILQPLQTLRKRNCKLLIGTQSLADFRGLWGDNASDQINANFDYIAVLGSRDTKSCKVFSDMCGTYTGEYEKQLKYIEPHKFARLDKKMVLIHKRGYHVLRKNYHFKGFYPFISRIRRRFASSK